MEVGRKQKNKSMDDNNNMGAVFDSGGEAIIICIDHTTHKQEYLKAQLEAVRIYATRKILSHPRTVVGLLTTAHAAFHQRFLVRPTRDLARLFCSFQDIKRGYSFGMIDTLSSAFFMLICDVPKGLLKRIVMFAGGIITMGVEAAANPLKREGVAVDVVNFTLGDILDSRKETLEAFVSAVNTDGKTHIIHVNEGSSLSNLLSSFMPVDAHVEANGKLIHSKKAIENEASSVTVKGMKKKNELIHLKKTTRLSSQKKATENENVSSKGAVGDEYADAHVEANGKLIHSKKAIENETSSVTVKGMKNKNELIHLNKTTRLSSQKKATENENVSSKGAVGHEYVDAHVEANGKLIHSKKAIENKTSSVMANGMKNKNQLVHLKKTTRLSSQKKATEIENVSSKGAVGDEYVKNAPSKLHNRSKHYRSLGQGRLVQICLIVSLLAALLMCAE